MNYSTYLPLALACAVLFPGAWVTAARAAHQLPADPSAEVIVFDSAGGFRRGPDNPAPILAVRADGGVVLANPYGPGTKKRRITQGQLQQLLSFILDENSFFDIDPAAVKRQMDQIDAQRQQQAGAGGVISRGLGRVADAGTITVRIHADGRVHEVSLHAPSVAVRRYPDIKPLQQFRKIQVRLVQLQMALLKQQPKTLGEE